MPTPQPVNYEDALERRAREVIDAAITDGEFMSQVRESLGALQRGERGTSLRELQAEERAKAAQQGA